MQIVNAVERDSGDYECQLTGEGTDHEDEDLVLNQKLEINVFDRDKSSSTKEGNESGGLDSRGGREKTSKAESVLASFVQNDRLRLAAEQEKEKSVLSRQERKSDERTNFQRSPSSTGSQFRVSLGLGATLLCLVL